MTLIDAAGDVVGGEAELADVLAGEAQRGYGTTQPVDEGERDQRAGAFDPALRAACRCR
jgi:hypothetical protein